MKTQFLSPIEQGRLIERIKDGDEQAERYFLEEFLRLERRIKQLESACETVENKYKNKMHTMVLNEWNA